MEKIRRVPNRYGVIDKRATDAMHLQGDMELSGVKLVRMNPLLIQEDNPVKKNHAFPFITIAVQTDISTVSKSKLEEKLSQFVERAEATLNSVTDIPDYMRKPAVNKLKSIISTLNYNANSKSIIIFLSPFIEKVYYLNFLIEERLCVGELLRMRDFVMTKKEEKKYLVLLLENEQSSIYYGEGELQKMITYNSTEHIKFALGKSKDEFFRHVDNVLTHILKVYPLPLIAIGSETSLADFKFISKNNNALTHCIYSNHSYSNEKNIATILQLITPVLQEWEKLKENYLKIELDKALCNKKAETGIADVYKAVKAKRGGLLIVERDFYYPLQFTDSNGVLNKSAVSSDGSLLVSDAVEDIIERLISNGGKVEFVNNNVLNDGMHLALII